MSKTARSDKHARSARHVIREIGCDKLSLVQGRGYWYFIYNDEDAAIHETHSVPTMFLGNLLLEDWVREGREFVAKMEGK
jgi:hypothetical protein